MAEEAVAEAAQDTTVVADETVTDATATEESTLATGEEATDDGGTVVTDAAEADVTYELNLPDDALLDADAQAAVIDFATEQKLSSEQAQAMAARENQALLNQEEALAETVEQLRTDWRNETIKDQEIGGDHLTETQGFAKQALNQIEGGSELAKLLNESGYGNHVAVVKFLRGVGKTLQNDSFPDGKEATAEKTIEQLFYDNTTEE